MGMFSAGLTAAKLFLGKIPPKVWIALAIVAALVGGYILHQREARQALAAEYARGAKDRDAAWEKRLDAEHKAALEWKAKAERRGSEISTQIGKSHEKITHDIDVRANDQRLRGPGKAAAPGCGSGGVAGVSTASSDHQPAAGSAGTSLAGLSSGEGLAIVPWDDLVSVAAGHDEWRSEALAWRDWYTQQAAANEAARAALGSK